MEGVIYYNSGFKCLARLAVSLSTLVRNFIGDITIICDKQSFEKCKAIADYFKVKILLEPFDNIPGKNIPMLNKCRLHLATPYEKTLFVDSDTMIFRDFSECFKLLDDNEFIVPQFCNWHSDNKQLKNRIENWRGKIDDNLVNHAFDEKAAINTGFYGWREGASIFNVWYDTAIKNRESFIPDEIACQILLPQYPHLIISNQYNVSCKHEPLTGEARTLHFHGRKHCRIENSVYKYHADMWYAEFDKIRELDCVKDIYNLDPMLRKHLHIHERIKNVKD